MDRSSRGWNSRGMNEERTKNGTVVLRSSKKYPRKKLGPVLPFSRASPGWRIENRTPAPGCSSSSPSERGGIFSASSLVRSSENFRNSRFGYYASIIQAHPPPPTPLWSYGILIKFYLKKRKVYRRRMSFSCFSPTLFTEILRNPLKGNSISFLFLARYNCLYKVVF